jgi:hypothetical protein
MKKIKRKRLVLARDVVKVLAAMPAAGLQYVRGGSETGDGDPTTVSEVQCSEASCPWWGCVPWPL